MTAASVATLAVLGLLLGAGPPLLMAVARWLSRFTHQAKTVSPLLASATPLPARLEIALLPRAVESPVSVFGSHLAPATAGVAHSPVLGHGQAASTAFVFRGAGPR